jgi:hypothetical protein
MNKWLYEFDAKNVIKKDDGSQDTLTKKFAILKPNRRLREDGELFYAAETSRFAKAGVLPKAAWGTILSNGGGSISDQEREEYGKLLLKFRDSSFELQSILIKGDGDRTEAEKLRSKELIDQLDEIRKDIQNFEASQIAIFENTAEAKARNRAILWWVMNLAYEKNAEEYSPIFKGESFEEKLIQYDSFEEEENKYEFLLGVVRRFMYLITLWFLGRADSVDDFKIFDENFIKENKIEPQEQDKKEQKTEVEEIKVEEKISIIEEIKSE